MTQVTRRRALTFSLFGCATLLGGCWSDEVASTPDTASSSTGQISISASGPASTGTAPSTQSATAWNVGPLYFSAGGVTTMDLTGTLPGGVAKGGTFELDMSGAALPRGMTLSPAGILAIGSATSGPVVGVIFTYTEPTG